MNDPNIPRVTINEVTQRLQVEYPCTWRYKVIGTDEGSLQRAIMEVTEGTSITFERSHTSSAGRYLSFNVDVVVHSDEQRTGLYESLRSHSAVRTVL